MKLKRYRPDGASRAVRLQTPMDGYVNGRGQDRAVDPADCRSLSAAGPSQQATGSTKSFGEYVRSAPGSVWHSFRRLTQLSFPKSYPIVQFPNAPLILAFVSGLVAHRSHGDLHAYAQAVSYLSMAVWAYLELFYGVNTFRRLLGLAYTVSTIVHLAGALHH